MQRLSECNYNSVYEDPFFRYLYVLHKMFGMKVSLYLYVRHNGWTLADVPDRYKHEFEETCDWLKFGFHAVSEEQKRNEVMHNWKESIRFYQDQVKRFAGEQSLSTIIRLHYWYYPQEYIAILKQIGVRTVLVRKDDKGKELYGIPAWRTDVQIEKDKYIARRIWIDYNFQEPLVVFSHEWALTWKRKIKFALAILLIKLRGYKFICE